MSDLITRGQKALKRIHQRNEDAQWTNATVGRMVSGVPTFDVTGKPNDIYVTIRQSNGAQTSPPARNDAGVPKALGLPVRLRKEVYANGQFIYVIDGISRRSDLAYTSPGQDPSVHKHDSRYFTETEITGAADLGAPLDTDKIGAVRAGGLGSILWSAIKTALNALYVLAGGKAGGQTIYGGTDNGDDLTLQSTAHATKGQLNMPDNTVVYGDGTSFLQVFFNGAAGAVRDFLFQSGGVHRWIMRVDSTAESGGDVGSNWVLMSRTDAGGAKVSAIIGERNGNIGFGGVFPLARVHVLQTTLGQPVLRLQSTSAGDDPTLDVLQNRITTTNATLTTLHTFAIPANNTVLIDCQVFARRTGGTAGTADDGAWYHKKSAYTTKAGVVTLLFQAIHDTDYEDVAAWDCDLNISGTNVLLQVTGAANTNITWHLFKAEVAMMSA